MVNRDYLHIELKGHAQVALMMIRYFQNVLQRAEQSNCINPGLRRPLFTNTSILVTNPLCWASSNPRWGRSDIHQSLHVSVERKHGFKELVLYSDKAKISFGSDSLEDRTDAFGGWVSKLGQGTSIDYPFYVLERNSYPPNG